MANHNSEQDGSAPEPPKKKIMLLAIVLVVGLLIGGGAGAFFAGPLMAERGAPPTKAHAAKTAEHEDAEDADEEGDAAEAEDGHHAEEDEEEEETEDHGKASEHGAEARPMYVIENLVLNPAGSGGTRFLMLTVALETKSGALVEQMKARDAEVRDEVLGVLANKTVEQLANTAARDSLKQEIRAGVSKIFRKGAVRRVYLPQFVIQ